MKNILLPLIYLSLFFCGQCKKEGKKCHHSIEIGNKSANNIVYALRFHDAGNGSKCLLSGSTLSPNATKNQTLKGCWEDDLKSGSTFECYMVDPTQYNDPNVFYSCDSVEIRNKILKHCVLTLDDLKKSNFVVTYP